MQKKIRNVFEYKDYRVLLNDDFLARSAGNHSYSMRAYSRDVELSSSFISDVLRGKRELSPKKARITFEKLGFELEELDYVESLISYKGSKDPIQKQASLEAINLKYKKPEFVNDEENDLVIKSADHFMIHGIVGGESDHKKIIYLAKKLDLSAERTQQIIIEFVEAGFFRQEKDQFFIQHKNINIPKHEKLLETQKQFVNKLIALTEATGGMRMPEQMGHYLVIGMDKNTMPLVEEAYRHLVNTLCRLSNQTPAAERYGFFSSSFFSISADTERTAG